LHRIATKVLGVTDYYYHTLIQIVTFLAQTLYEVRRLARIYHHHTWTGFSKSQPPEIIRTKWALAVINNQNLFV